MSQSNQLSEELNQQHGAIRLAETNTLTNQQWLEVRKQGIGSSDAAAACGINPYMSMLELWMVKTGRINSGEDDSLRPYSPFYWGHALEPLLARYYQQVTGHKVRRVNAVLKHPDPDKHFMLANLDYAITGSDEVQILECKTAGRYGSILWKRGVPLYVICQVQHQLAVTGKQAAHICVLSCGHEAHIFKVERDDQIITQLIQAERQFWKYVQDDTPPPPDHSLSAGKALQQLYPKPQPGSITDLTDDPTQNLLFEKLLSHKHSIDECQKNFNQVKHQLQLGMQQTEVAQFKGGSITWKRSKDSTVLDTKTLLAKQPELIKEFGKNRKGSRRFLISEN